MISVTPDTAGTQRSEPRTNGPITDRARLVGDGTGAVPDAIAELPFDLSVLIEEGVVVDVDARGTGMFETSIDLAELGVVWDHPERRSPVRPVKCLLVPPEVRNDLLRPAVRGHDILSRYSFRFLVLEIVTSSISNRWVPWRAWPEFKASFEASRRQLENAKAEYEERYGVVQEQMRETFSLLAADTVKRLRATSRDGEIHLPVDLEDRFVERMLSRIPGPETVVEHLALSYRVRPLRLGSEMLGEQRRAMEERMRIRKLEVEVRVRREEADARARAVQAQLWADEERIKQRLVAERQELEREARIKEELGRLRVQAAREEIADTLSPLQEGLEQLHSAVHESALAIRDALRDGRLEAHKALELGRMYRLLNFTTDAQLDELVAEMERLTLDGQRTGKRKRQDAPIDRVLSDIIRVTYEGARSASERSRADAIRL